MISMAKIKKDKLIVKSNYLVEASYRLTITEQKIMYMIISMINKNDTDFKDYEFKVNDFIKAIGLKGQSAYTELKNIIRTLRSRTFTIKYSSESRGKELITGWIVSAEYDDGNLKFNIDPKLKPFLLQLQSHFTAISLSNLMQLRSSYSTRIYELLKQYKNIGERSFKIDDLKRLLAIEDDEYKLYAHFKSRVIVPSQQELRDKTDISFEFEEIKEGRKVASIKFIIKPVEVEEQIAMDIQPSKLVPEPLIIAVKSILEEDITDDGAKTLLEASNGNIELISAKYKIAQKQKKPINDIIAWMKDAIEKNYEDPVGKKQKMVADANSSKRQYDVVALERQLLGRNNSDNVAN